VLGAAEELELELIQPHMAQKPMLRGEVGDGSVKVLILSIVISQRRNTRTTGPVPPPSLSLGWHVKDEHVKNTAQDVSEDVT